MAEVDLNNSTIGNSLQEILMAPDIEPGQSPSYQLCKTIYTSHVLGAKMAEAPVSMAQSQKREISIPESPEEVVRDAFMEEWENLGADDHIHNVYKTARIYGVASLAMLTEGTPLDRPIVFQELSKAKIAFNVFDPLNTAGSLVLNQNANAMDFLKQQGIAVQGSRYHRSRAVTVMNEKPIFLGYTDSAFGYVGRSVYQRALYPLKSFIQTMVTDDMVARKAGIIVYKAKPAGSMVSNAMLALLGVKLAQIKAAVTNNILGIVAPEEEITAIDLTNVNTAMEMSRTNIIKNISTAADMPAKILLEETLAEGFGEGTEDAKYIAAWVARFRVSMNPVYSWMDQIVQYRAWNMDFYETIQKRFPEEYGRVPYLKALMQWRNSFKALWPNLLQEPDSEKVETDDVKLRAIMSAVEILLGKVRDPVNVAIIIQWMADNMNENKFMFSNPLELEYDLIESSVETAQTQQEESHEHEMRPETLADSVRTIRRAVGDFNATARRINDAVKERRLNG